MRPPRNPDLEKRRDSLLVRLHALPNFMRGSVYEKTRKCGNPTCGCATGGDRHSTRQLTVPLGGKMRTRYVRVEEFEEVQALIATYHELWAIVEELTAVNLELLRGSHPGGKPKKRKRP